MTSDKYEAMAREICKKHLVTFPEFVEAVAKALKQIESETLERAAKIAETWPCVCNKIYPKGKEQYHSPDCYTKTGEDIACEIRTLKEETK